MKIKSKLKAGGDFYWPKRDRQPNPRDRMPFVPPHLLGGID